MKKIIFKILFWVLWPLVWLYAPLRTRSRILVVCGDEFLVVRAYFGNGAWQLPGGGVGFGESAATAAIRELNEELSIYVSDVKNILPMTTYKECGLLMRYIVFLSVLQTKPLVTCNKEIYEAKWLPINNSLRLLPHIQKSLTAYVVSTKQIR